GPLEKGSSLATAGSHGRLARRCPVFAGEVPCHSSLPYLFVVMTGLPAASFSPIFLLSPNHDMIVYRYFQTASAPVIVPHTGRTCVGLRWGCQPSASVTTATAHIASTERPRMFSRASAHHGRPQLTPKLFAQVRQTLLARRQCVHVVAPVCEGRPAPASWYMP